MKKQNSVFTASKILVLGALLFTLIAASFVPKSIIPLTGAGTIPFAEENTLPTIWDFTNSLINGKKSEPVGVYVDDILALEIIQQPINNPAFVSTIDDVVTQFDLANDYDTIGLLAHNYLAGDNFYELEEGQEISLIYGTGNTKKFHISDIQEYQALSPHNIYSDFVNLEDNSRLSASDLFMSTYGLGDVLVLQTCIEKNGEDSWGRMFIIAEPATLELGFIYPKKI